MFASFRFFQREYEKHLKVDFSIDARISPCKLIEQLKSPSNCKQLTKTLSKKTQHGFKIMRKLTIAHLLLMYSNNFFDTIQPFVSEPYDSSDQWLNEQCIRTYFHFLKKVVASSQLYIRVKDYSSKQVSFQSLFYIINLMNDMFKIVSKMPLLGRYFKDANQIVTCSFIETIAVQAQKLYTVFKSSLQEILSCPRNYIINRDDQKLVKAILEESLPFINEQMKKLFLDKYFYPYGKGIGIRLFRTEEQPQETIKIINGILSDHRETERNLAQATLEKTMFPEQGIVNIQFFQRTLKPNEKSKFQQVVVKDLQQIQEEDIVVPTQFNETMVQKVQKQTSHHLQICHDV